MKPNGGLAIVSHAGESGGVKMGIHTKATDDQNGRLISVGHYTP